MTMDRRSVIKGAGALGSVLLAPNLPMWAKADEVPDATAPADFVTISSVLLNIPATTLGPAAPQDDIQLADIYYSVLMQASAQCWSNLVYNYNQAVSSGLDPQQTANYLLSYAGTFRQDPGGVGARLVAMMWLFGTWYGGTENKNYPESIRFMAADYRQDFVISGRAYVNGWIWRLAQAHPMGFSQFNFGSWASPPPDLANFVNV